MRLAWTTGWRDLPGLRSLWLESTSGTSQWGCPSGGTRAHNPVGLRNATISHHEDQMWLQETYERQYLRAVIVTWSSAWDSNPESPDLETIPSLTPILQELNLPKHQSAKLFGRPHYCYGCATRAKAKQIDAKDAQFSKRRRKEEPLGMAIQAKTIKKGMFAQTPLQVDPKDPLKSPPP